MSGYVDRTNTRADHVNIYGLRTDENGVVLMGQSLFSLRSTLKNFEYVTTVCDECSTEEEPVAAWVDEHGDEVCPECGMICSDRRNISHSDPKFVQTRGTNQNNGVSLAPCPSPYNDDVESRIPEFR